MKTDLLSSINRADLQMWKMFASEHRQPRYTLLHNKDNPANFWINSAYEDHIGGGFKKDEIVYIKRFYENLGLQGHLRDFTQQFGLPPSYHYLCWSPERLPKLSLSSDVTVKNLERDQLQEFAEQVRDCFGYDEGFIAPFVNRMQTVAGSVDSKFIKILVKGQIAGVLSLFDAGEGWWALLNVAVRPELRGAGLSTLGLRAALSRHVGNVFTVTDNEILIKSTLPRLGFEVAGRLSLVPLQSVGPK